MYNKHRYRTVQVSISMPLDLLLAVEELATDTGRKRSETIQWLIRCGITYQKLLQEQKKQQKEKEVK